MNAGENLATQHLHEAKAAETLIPAALAAK
jgi:hypothetical protein